MAEATVVPIANEAVVAINFLLFDLFIVDLIIPQL
jgi:hypothetical protein